ncbi:MAG: AAA family ATPase [Thalassotalea sp.]|nr:AAA family ATPase [Thalassotalea sp.]
MKAELKTDLDTYLKRKSTPLFHKIKFDETSIYLTKASYFENGLVNTGKNDFGNYRVFSWADYRAKAFLGFELGQDSPALGRANIIGSFTPNEDDIKDVKYISDNGKSYFKSAHGELSGVSIDTDDEVIKIDAENFMKMAEIIPTGAQGKAIYGESNYIIDGPAGTGKSTTVLQKIKLLQLHSNVDSSAICIVVKNNQVVKNFEGLLQGININDIKICTVDVFLSEFSSSENTVTEELLISASKIVSDLVSNYEKLTNIDLLSSSRFNQEGDEFKELKRHVVGSDSFTLKLTDFLSLARKLRNQRIANDKVISTNVSKLREETQKLTSQLTKSRLEKNKKSVLRRLGLSKGNDELTLSEQTAIKDQVDKYASNKNKEIKKRKERLASEIEELYKKLTQFKENITKELLSPNSLALYIDDNELEGIVKLYCNKHYPHLNSLHTVIIDEAQDVSAIAIELIRLQAESVVLAGDESQTENNDGIGSWKNLIGKENYEIDGVLNIYQLRHNFRQTYELGAASYNYRQLLLDRDICDLKADYFDDQIGFNKPQLVFVNQDSDFHLLVKTKLQYIKEAFTSSFPLVIFYENEKSLNRLTSLIKSNDYTFNIDDHLDNTAQILFVSISDIAGREFPVVIAPLTNVTSKNTVYVMLSRAKFDLTLITGGNRKVDTRIQTLCEQNIIGRSTKPSEKVKNKNKCKDEIELA